MRKSSTWTNKLRGTSQVIGLLLVCIVLTLILCLILDSVEFPKLREPRPLPGVTWLYPSESPLLDLPQFKYLLNNDVCGGDSTLRAVIIITSHAGDVQARAARRRAFPFSELHRLKLRRVFLLAQATNKHQIGYKYIKQEAVVEENKRYGDIIQGSFQEAYRNLSYKHVMGLKWAATYCASADYVIKVDDDIAVNYYALLNILDKYDLYNAIAGYVLGNLTPDRGNSKWRVSHEEWPDDHYPTFVSGWLYATSPRSAQKLVDALESHRKIFWIDDVLVSGIARQFADVELVDLSKHFVLHAETLRCCIQGYGCDFVVAPTAGDWALLEKYMQMTTQTRGLQTNKSLLHRGHECVVTSDPDSLPFAMGRGQSKPISL